MEATLQIPDTTKPRVVIIGGGFGGVSIAKELVAGKDFQIVLIDRQNYHTFQPLLYQVSTSSLEPESIAYPLRKIVKKGKNTFFRMAEVLEVNTLNKEIRTTLGSITYDYLVIATGARTNFFGNKIIEQNAMRMKSVPQALKLRSLMLENLEQAVVTPNVELRKELLNFVIVGGGPTGVELAGGLAELRENVLPRDYPDMDFSEMEIHLIESADRILPPMSLKSSNNAKRFLEKLGVKIHLDTFVTNYMNHIVSTSSSLELRAATFVWSAGVIGAPIQGINGEALVERANRYKVNEYNQVFGFKNVFAIGDIALMQSEEYERGHPMVAQPAIQQGKHLAKNILAKHKNKPLKPFRYFDKGSMATIGRNKAVVDINKLSFGGFFAWVIWMFIHLMFLVGFRNKIITLFNWVYNYINFDKASRLIITPFKAKEDTNVV